MSPNPLPQTDGPFQVSDLKPGDPYELANGRLIECLPAGGQHSNTNLTGGVAVHTDPKVSSSGVDAGFALSDQDLRAPDIAVGVPNEPGWIEGVPPLVVEYADRGQNEQELQDKIADLLAAGTRYIWVVRLKGSRRVEVYEPGGKKRTVRPGQLLKAPEVLQNPLPVEALYDRDAAHEVALRNLLQRQGYADLEAVLQAGKDEGKQEGRQAGLAEGTRQGRKEGEHQKALEIARALAAEGFPRERIAALTGLAVEEVESMASTHSSDTA